MSRGWIGVDFDGTLAEYDKFMGPLEFGPPIPAMVDKIKGLLADGRVEVRIFTARVSHPDPEMTQQIRLAIQNYCFQHVGVYLAVTNCKDFEMVECWDDRAVQVVPNTGEFVGESRYL